jgi:hypothetical protein
VVAFLQATQGFRRLDHHRRTTIPRKTREGTQRRRGAAAASEREPSGRATAVFDAASTQPVIRLAAGATLIQEPSVFRWPATSKPPQSVSATPSA